MKIKQVLSKLIFGMTILLTSSFNSGVVSNQPDPIFSALAPVTVTEMMSIMNENVRAYWIKKSAAFTNPVLVNPTVNVADIYAYYESNNESGKYQGIRFYPAFDSASNKIFLVMCLAENPETNPAGTDEDYFVALDQGYYLSQNSITIPGSQINMDRAGGMHRDYLKNVWLYKNAQDTTTSSDTLRFSRYYSWTEFRGLADMNLPTNANKSKFYFQIDIGYLTRDWADILKLRSTSTATNTQQRGFTVFVHVKEEDGNSLLDPWSVYNSSGSHENTNYLRRSLEVGHPCPPLCGEMHQN